MISDVKLVRGCHKVFPKNTHRGFRIERSAFIHGQVISSLWFLAVSCCHCYCKSLCIALKVLQKGEITLREACPNFYGL